VRLITEDTTVSAESVLLNSSPSGIVLSGSTTAVLWRPGAGTRKFGAVAVMAIVRAFPTPPPRIVAPAQLTTPPAWLHVNAAPGPPASATETKVSPTGSTSRTLTFKAGSEPSFHTCSV